MATLATTHPTLLDITKRTDPNGKIDKIAEILNQTNQILDDMVWVEGNLPTGHRLTVRTGLPAPTWRKLYGGVQPTKSTTAQVTESCGMLEAYAEVDAALADLNGNTDAFLLSENRAHIEGMGQEFASSIFNANESNEPEAFTGFGPRCSSTTAENAINLLDAGSDDDNCTSIYLIGWGPNTVYGIYPKGSKTGLQMTNKGQVTVENANSYSGSTDAGGGRYEAYRTHYRWDCGLAVADWRYVVRIHSIELDALTKAGAESGGDADLTDYMAQALELLPSLDNVRPVFYCNRKIRSFLRRQMEYKLRSSTLSWDMIGGKRVLSFCEVPVKRCDALLNTEDRV